MTFRNPEPEAIRELLRSVKTIAVVGFSPKPGRASHNIARQLQRFGYRIIPVRPGISEGLGEKAYPNLSAVPDPIDLVNVFRSPGQVPPHRRGVPATGPEDNLDAGRGRERGSR